MWDAPSTLLTPMAKKMLRTSLSEIFCSDLAEVSLLNLLFQISTWVGSLEYASTIEGGAQQDLVTGGAQTMANRIAAKLATLSPWNRPCTGSRRPTVPSRWSRTASP